MPTLYHYLELLTKGGALQHDFGIMLMIAVGVAALAIGLLAEMKYGPHSTTL